MATYPPPNFIEPLDEFNTSNWITSANAVGFTPEQITYLNSKYLKYPVAQGLETLQAIIVNGVATFNNTALPTSLGTLPAPNTISTQIPTMDWVQQAIVAGGQNVLANNNTWTGSNDFTTTIINTSTQPAPNTANTDVPTTAWVQNAITYSQNLLNGYGGLQEALIYSELPYNYSQLTSTASTTLYTYGVNSASFASSKSLNTCAYSVNNGIYICLDPTKPINTLAQSTLLNMNPAPQLSFEPCALSFSADGRYGLATSNQQGVDTSEVYLYSNISGTPQLNAVSGLYGYYSDCVLSADGQYQLIATITGYDTLLLSTDYGATFNEIAPIGVYYSVAMSATGQYQMGISQFSGIMNSSDFGVNWTTTPLNNSFLKCSMSANGQFQIAICNDGGNADSFFMSYDYGATWNNIDSLVSGTQKWVNLAISDCGRIIIAYANNNLSFLSTNYGKSFTQPTTNSFLNGYSKNMFAVNGKYLMGQKTSSIPQYVGFTSFW